MSNEEWLKDLGYIDLGGCHCTGKPSAEFVPAGEMFPKIQLFAHKNRYTAWLGPGNIKRGHYKHFQREMAPHLNAE